MGTWKPVGDRYFLGWVCPHKHFYGQTGKTLRYRRHPKQCVECLKKRVKASQERAKFRGNELGDRLTT